MKKLLLFVSLVGMGFYGMATVHTVTNSGLTFSPANISVNQGDTVVFNIAGNHNVIEVDSSTWVANGSTSNGGFTLPFGGGSLTMSTAGSFFYVCQPHAGAGMKGKIVVNPVTSIEENSITAAFSYYPNPAKDEVVIETAHSNLFQDVVIYNIEGKEVLKTPLQSNRQTINLTGLSKGSYLLELRGENAILRKKIIIE